MIFHKNDVAKDNHVLAVGSRRWNWKFREKHNLNKVKNYNLNVTEVRDSDFKNAFPGIFNFTVGILPGTLVQS